MNVHNEIRQILVLALAVKEEEIQPEAHLQDDLGADSLAIMNLAEAICEKYGIEIEGDDILDAENLNGIVALVESKISSKP